LATQDWVGEKPCLETVDTEAYVNVVRPDIATGWPERQPNQRFQLQTVSWEALPILKEVFLTLTLGRRQPKSWVFVADITNEFILGLDILRAYDGSVDLGRQTLRLAEEEVSLWTPGAGPRPSSLVVAKDHVKLAQCEGRVMARIENSLGVENRLVEPSPQAHPPEGIYTARTLVQDRQEVPVRVLNATHRGQKLAKEFPLAHCEPVTLVTDRDMEPSKAQDTNSKLHGVMATARPNINNREFQELGELLTKYEHICAGDSED
jgi:hypothetical protein